jgi:hypothetical protein
LHISSGNASNASLTSAISVGEFRPDQFCLRAELTERRFQVWTLNGRADQGFYRV